MLAGAVERVLGVLVEAASTCGFTTGKGAKGSKGVLGIARRGWMDGGSVWGKPLNVVGVATTGLVGNACCSPQGWVNDGDVLNVEASGFTVDVGVVNRGCCNVLGTKAVGTVPKVRGEVAAP